MLPLLRNLRPGLPVLAVLVAITALSCGSSPQNTPTPSGTATSVVEQSPTAEATASPTQEPTNGPSPTPQVTPTRSPTATPAPPTTTPEPTMEPTPVSTPQPEPGVIFTVENGSLPLRPGAVAPTQFNSGVSAVDFRAAATFFNPFHPVSPWNYGFKFRDASGKYQVIVIDHDGVLSYLTGQDNQLELVSSVTISGLHTTADDSNRIGLMVLGDTAWVFLNGNMVQAFHIGAVSVSGGISLITDIYHETSIQNASVRFNNFTINRAALIYSSDSGTLRKPSPTDIAVGDASPPTSAGYVKVTLVSPIAAFSGDYSYGILFRSRDGSADNWLVFDDSKKWQHIRRDADGKEKVLAQGTSSSLKTGHHDENTIEIVSTEDRQLVYVNGNLEITLMLPVDDRPFVVSPFAGFLPSQQPVEMVTDYRDFEVWSTLD